MDVFFRNGKNAVLRKVNIMKREGQVRIPSGCAISAVISREGRRMTGEKIVESMIPMHDRSNGLAAASPHMAFIRNTGTTMPSTSF